MKIERREVLFGGLAAMCAIPHPESQAAQSPRPINVRIAGVMTKECGLVGTKWSDIKPGDVVIVSEWDDRGCMMDQWAFRAVTAPDTSQVGEPLTVDIMSLDDAWAYGKQPSSPEQGRWSY